MAVSSTTRRAGPFTGNGVTTVFPFEFRVFQASDLYVVKGAPDGSEVVLVLDSDYTITFNADQDTSPGGDITLAVPLPADYDLAATSAIGTLQETVLTNNGGFYPKVLNDVNDKAVILIQQVEVGVDRAVQAPLGETGPRLPKVALRASKLAVFDAEGEFDVSRDLADFDQAVTNTANHAGQVAQDLVATTNAKIAAEEAQASSELLFENFGTAANLVELVTEEARNAAIAAAEEAEALLEEIQDFYDSNGASLAERVDLLENPVQVTLDAYVGGVLTTQAEVGQSLTVTLTKILNRDVGTCTINQGIGDVLTTAGTQSGIPTGAAVTASKTWTVTATPAPAGLPDIDTATITFYNRMFWGAYATNDLHTKTAAEIRTALLATSALASNANRTFSVDGGSGAPKWIYFAVPAAFSLSAFTAFGFDEFDNLTYSVVNIDDYAGTDVSYRLYRLPNALNGVVPMVTNA